MEMCCKLPRPALTLLARCTQSRSGSQGDMKPTWTARGTSPQPGQGPAGCAAGSSVTGPLAPRKAGGVESPGQQPVVQFSPLSSLPIREALALHWVTDVTFFNGVVTAGFKVNVTCDSTERTII